MIRPKNFRAGRDKKSLPLIIPQVGPGLGMI